jgi:adenylate cyclase
MHALQRIAAPPKVRLACQMRPRRDLTIVPLLAATASAREARREDSIGGREEFVTVLFLDLRNSTALAEHLLPYDVVYILNQFLSEMVAALRISGGYYSQFTGDGLMALYGLGSTPEVGCRAAIHGAVEMLQRFDATTDWLHPDIGESLRIGIGIHSGEAIVGRMGPPEAPVLSAIGDTVNIAARLEAMCKAYDCSLVISEVTARRAGIDMSAFPSHSASTRGRRAPITVYAVGEPQKIADQFPDAPELQTTRE